MPKTFHLTIRTPDEEIINDNVESLTLTTEECGIMEVLPHHASLTGMVFFSPLIVKMGDREEDFIAKRGVLLVSNEDNSATLLCLSCQKKKEITTQTIKEYLEFIEQKLKQGSNLNQFQLTHLKEEKVIMQLTLKEIKEKSKIS